MRLLGTAFSLSLRRALAYRVNLFFDALLAMVELTASIATIGIVFTQTGLLAGWSQGQMLTLVERDPDGAVRERPVLPVAFVPLTSGS